MTDDFSDLRAAVAGCGQRAEVVDGQLRPVPQLVCLPVARVWSLLSALDRAAAEVAAAAEVVSVTASAGRESGIGPIVEPEPAAASWCGCH